MRTDPAGYTRRDSRIERQTPNERLGRDDLSVMQSHLRVFNLKLQPEAWSSELKSQDGTSIWFCAWHAAFSRLTEMSDFALCTAMGSSVWMIKVSGEDM